MSAQLIPGKRLAQNIIAQLAQDVSAMENTPGMAALLIGDNSASRLYVKIKERTCHTIGIAFEKVELPENVDEATVLAEIDKLNARDDIHGVLIQLPLPAHLNTDAIIERLDPAKDVDGFHPQNIARYMADNPPYIRPVLIKGILRLIEHTEVPLRDKRAVILGNSDVFMRPLGSALLRRDMKVVWQTPSDDWQTVVKTADVVITAIGKPHHITAEHLKEGAVCIDVGITEVDNEVRGDIAPSAQSVASWITPVPGGVGPMTVAMLMENVVKLAKRHDS